MKNKKVMVLIGVGGIGSAIAYQAGMGYHVLCADLDEKNARQVSKVLEAEGIPASAAKVDITSSESLSELVEKAKLKGSVSQLILATGLSPSSASADSILNVDLYGVALVLESFGQIISKEGSGLVVGSQAGHRLPALSPEVDQLLATTPAKDLLGLEVLNSEKIKKEPLYAYQLAKRACSLRIQYEATKWAKRGARLNIISPGFITTSLSEKEKSGPNAKHYKTMLDAIVCKRPGHPDEVANLAAFLLGPEGNFITGSDFLIDGGVTAAYRFGGLELEF